MTLANTNTNTNRTAISIDMEAEVTIDAPPEQVWRSLTDGIGEWWPHSFADATARIVLEPRIGGRFFECFDTDGVDADGAGALYALVTYIEPNRTLRISGSMGMWGARQYVKTYRLEPTDRGTVVRTTASMLGDIPDDMLESYRSGGEAVLRALRDHVERTSTTEAGTTPRGTRP